MDGAVYVAAEPHHLVCLDAGTGAQRWKATADVLDLPDHADLRSRWAATAEALWLGRAAQAGLARDRERILASLAQTSDEAGPVLTAQERHRLETLARDLEPR